MGWGGGDEESVGTERDDIGYSSGSGPHLGCGHARMKMPSSFPVSTAATQYPPSPSSTPFTHGNRACPTFLRLKIHSQYVHSRTREIRSPPLPRIRRRRIIVARSGEGDEAWGGEEKKAPSSHLLGGGGPKNRMGFPPLSFPILLWLGREEKKVFLLLRNRWLRSRRVRSLPRFLWGNEHAIFGETPPPHTHTCCGPKKV